MSTEDLRGRADATGTPGFPTEQRDVVHSPSATLALDRVVRAGRAMLERGGPFTSAELEALVGCSSRQLARDFGAVLGVSPRSFGHAARSGQARTLLRAREQVLDAIFGSGHGSVRAFYETTAPTLGMTPAQYASGGAGQLLRWTQVDTAVGAVLAVAGDLGLTAVHIGPDPVSMLADVQDGLPHARLDRADDELAETAAALRDLAEGRPTKQDLPADVGGTAFQARVWSALRRIPAGQTRSYSEVAAELGAPSAVRAVARACGANRTALVVPCHRVVRADGGLGGYRWGLEVKRQLLAAEAAAVA